MSAETREQAINDGFERMEGFDDQRRFPPAMQVNKLAIKKAFRIAGLACSRITIEPMSQSDMAMNKDSLFVTEKVDNGWKITANDGEMRTKSAKKNSRNDHWESFTQEFNDVIISAVLECIKKEKDFRIGVQSEKFLALGFKAFTLEFLALGFKAFIPYDIVKCYHFLYSGDGRTLVRKSK